MTPHVAMPKSRMADATRFTPRYQVLVIGASSPATVRSIRRAACSNPAQRRPHVIAPAHAVLRSSLVRVTPTSRTRLPGSPEELRRLAEHLQVLARVHDERAYRPEPAERVGHAPPDYRRVLADAAGERHGVEPAENGDHPARLAKEPVQPHVEGEP